MIDRRTEPLRCVIAGCEFLTAMPPEDADCVAVIAAVFAWHLSMAHDVHMAVAS